MNHLILFGDLSQTHIDKFKETRRLVDSNSVLHDRIPWCDLSPAQTATLQLKSLAAQVDALCEYELLKKRRVAESQAEHDALETLQAQIFDMKENVDNERHTIGHILNSSKSLKIEMVEITRQVPIIALSKCACG